jgi:hypothetical protein
VHKLAITEGYQGILKDLPFGCEFWCSVAAIGPIPGSLRVFFWFEVNPVRFIGRSNFSQNQVS